MTRTLVTEGRGLISLLLTIGLALLVAGCQLPMSDADDGGTAPTTQSSDGAASDDAMAEPTSHEPTGYEASMPPEPGSSASGAGGGSGWRERFADLEAMEKVSQEERKAVVNGLVEQAHDDVARGDLERAAARLDEAVAILPGDREAIRMRADVNRALGNESGYAATQEMLVAEAQVQRDQLRMEALAYYNAGREAYELGDYEEASTNLRRFLDVVEWSAYDLELGDQREPARQLMQLADRRAKEKTLADESKRRQQARDSVLSQERREARLRARRIRDLYEEGIREFENRRFDRSEDIAREILRVNPGDRTAERLRDQSVMLRHRKLEESLVADKVNRWRAFLQDMQESKIPWQETIVWPDDTTWAEINQRAAGSTFDAGDLEDSAAVATIKSRLENTRITLEFEEQPLPEVLSFIQDIADVNIVLDPEVAETFDSDGTLITLPVEDLKLSAALDILFNMHNLKGTYKDDVLYVTSSDKVVGDTVLRLHDIKDLITTLTDFPGASIQLVESSGDEFGGGAIFDGDESVPTFEAEDIVELIQTSIEPETWEEDASRFSISTSGGNLIVRHTPAVHAEINRFLGDLRAFSGILVSVETRFLQVSDYFLESIGVDVRGLGDTFLAGANPPQTNNDSTFATIRSLDVGDGTIGGAGANRPIDTPGGRFDNAGNNQLSSGFFYKGSNQDIRARSENIFDTPLGRQQSPSGGLTLQWTLLDDAEYNFLIQAVSKSTQATELIAPRLTAFNTQRANITIANQVSYISDFDVEVAQTSQIADPIVSVIQDGLVLDVRPTVSYDLKYITLEIKPTVALLERPLNEITTSLGAGGMVTIQLPELEVRSAATTVKIPDGGSLLLGGLKTALSEDRKSTAPFVDDIPVLSFFFRKKGRVEELDHLVILVKGNITDLAADADRRGRGF